jgi:CIC family chloride channel protein
VSDNDPQSDGNDDHSHISSSKARLSRAFDKARQYAIDAFVETSSISKRLSERGRDGSKRHESRKILSEDDDSAPMGLLLLLSFVIGVFGGFGAIIFKAVISFFHNLFFLGEIAFGYDETLHMPESPWLAGIIFVPVIGAVIVTFITSKLAPEARGGGVPEVLDAIYYREGKIRPVVVVAKAVASAVSIGTGGSVGREGPIIQIGAAFGSFTGQLAKLSTRQNITLIAAGAGAGIAATFNAPIGGLAFAIELLLVSVSARTVTLVALSTVTATYIGRFYSGTEPSFNVPGIAGFTDHVMSVYSLAFSLPLGILIGIASALFIHVIYAMEDWFDARAGNAYLRHMGGMFIVGCMIYGFMWYTGHYYVAGVGYASILDVLKGVLTDPLFLLVLFAGKLLATGLTLGSGASGGIFSPSLFLGACMGAAFGNLAVFMMPQAGIDPVVYAIAGMAGMVSGTTGAILTAITMIFEQTRDYAAMLPIITCAALAYIVRAAITPESIYTLKLVRRGVHVPQGMQSAVTAMIHASRLMNTNFQCVDIADFRSWTHFHHPGRHPRYTVVTKNGKIFGFARDELLYLLRDHDVERVIDTNFFLVTEATKWPTIMRGMRIKDAEAVLVTSKQDSRNAEDLVGIITPREILHYSRVNAKLMSG